MIYIENFVDQNQVLPVVRQLNFRPITRNSREVCQFGYEYTYFSNKLEKTENIPDALNFNSHISAILGKPIEFNQLIVNKYEVGQGISPHIDNPDIFGDIIACISIGCDCTVKFEGDKSYKIRGGSLYIMTGDHRYKFKHSIGRHAGLRYSLTYRLVA